MGIFSYFAVVLEEARRIIGEMLEWLKRHAWKACKRQKCFAGSNPALSAVVMENVKAGKQLKQINNN